MERNESRMTWGIIIGLILVGAFASAVWPTLSAQISGSETQAIQEPAEPIVIDIESYLMGKELLGVLGDFAPDLLDTLNENINGREISQPIAIGILVAITVGSLVLLAGPIALIYTRLEKQASTVKEDETFQAAVSSLDKRQTAELKERQQANPSHIDDDPVEDRRGFSYTMALLGIVFAWVIGSLLAQAAYGGEMIESGGELVNPVSIINLIVLIVSVVAVFLYFRFIRKPEEIDLTQTDNAPVSWGWLWVIVSGMLIVGIGTGLAITLTSGGPPPG